MNETTLYMDLTASKTVNIKGKKDIEILKFCTEKVLISLILAPLQVVVLNYHQYLFLKLKKRPTRNRIIN